MKRSKGGGGGIINSISTSRSNIPRSAVRRRRRANSKCSLFEFLLYTFLIFCCLLMGSVYYYHFVKEPANAADTAETDRQTQAKADPRNQEEEKEVYDSIFPNGHERPPVPYADDDDPGVAIVRQPVVMDAEHSPLTYHLFPKVPPIPIFSHSHIEYANVFLDTLSMGRPTVAGVLVALDRFLADLRKTNHELVKKHAEIMDVIENFHKLAHKYLWPMEDAYRHEPMYQQRSDDSIFMSLAAFREHLLYETLANAYRNAKNPDKLFVGAVVQNCFGKVDEDGTIHTEGKPCRTGAQVIGKNKQGKDQTKVSDAPPDVNGIETFCNDPKFKKYCDNGNIRALYVHESESAGPAMARYFASKLWGGEMYFMQSDSHLQFAKHWDARFIAEMKATKSYPKSVLSSYPPGFSHGEGLHDVDEERAVFKNGARLCDCVFSDNAIEQDIIRIGTGGAAYRGDETAPSQIAFIAAGFFFTRAEFLVDVPFDPYIPYCFMGEEIALSLRAWTYGWNIYAPRQNLINHQYRPGRMGLPKFWGSVNRMFRPSKKGVSNNSMQKILLQRIKNMVGYKESSTEQIKKDGYEIVLTELDKYGPGPERTLEEYLKFVGIDMENKKCRMQDWCSKGTLL